MTDPLTPEQIAQAAEAALVRGYKSGTGDGVSATGYTAEELAAFDRLAASKRRATGGIGIKMRKLSPGNATGAER